VPSQLVALDFAHDIERLTADFVGRHWLLEEVADWLARGGERFFLLTGEPGVGKSAVAARLTQVRGDVAAYHFCLAGRVDTVTPGTVLRSLAAQLGESLPGYGAALANTIKPVRLSVRVSINVETMTGGQVTGVILKNLAPSDPETELEILLRAPLGALAPPARHLLLVVDYLDEAVTYRGEPNLVTLLTKLEGQCEDGSSGGGAGLAPSTKSPSSLRSMLIGSATRSISSSIVSRLIGLSSTSLGSTSSVGTVAPCLLRRPLAARGGA
jgi:hypothetical protein